MIFLIRRSRYFLYFLLLAYILVNAPELFLCALNTIYTTMVIYRLFPIFYGSFTRGLPFYIRPSHYLAPTCNHKKLLLEDLPNYSIIMPLFMEQEVLEELIENISAIKYPKDKMQVLIVLEEEDVIMQHSIKSIKLPEFFQVIIVPRSNIQTKGNACNYALNFVKGEYCVIYDAEDKPDVYQLSKAVQKFHALDASYVCLQAKLNYYNWNENFLTKMFAIEYAILFDYVIPMLVKFNFSIPLGGTSNHFKTSVLKEIGGWDALNVTEDAELGIRIKSSGFKVGIIDSYTLEEAPIHVRVWIKQRMRWMKGHLKTYLDLISAISKRYQNTKKSQNVTTSTLYNSCIMKILDFVSISCLIGMPTIFFAISPIIFIVFFFADLGEFTRTALRFSGIFGIMSIAALSFITMFNKNLNIETKLWFLFPIYFVLHSVASLFSIYQLYKAPFFWNKTPHGLSKKRRYISDK